MKGFSWRGPADILTGLLIVAAIYVLVRPSSPGATLVQNLTTMFVAIVKNAADLGNQ